MLADINKEIREKYKEYVDEIREKSSHLLSGNYSNVFVASTTEEWVSAKNKILIVGQEAKWPKMDSCYDIEKTQEWVYEFLHDQIKQKKYGNELHTGSFWTRFRKIVKKVGKDTAFAWGNLDVINAIEKKGKGVKLDKGDRHCLHSTEIKILGETIKVLQPTVVLFCGWSERRNAFKAQLPQEVFDAFYKNYEKHKIDGYKIYEVCYDDTYYVLSYHPRYGGLLTGYEDAVVETIERELKI